MSTLQRMLCGAFSKASHRTNSCNAAFDVFTADEVKAVGMLHRLAPAGSVIVAGATSTPWADQDYSRYTRRTVQSLCEADFAPAACLRTLTELVDHEASAGGITLLLTRGNQASLAMQGQMSDAGFASFERGVRALPGTRLLFANPDARIYRLIPDDPSATRGRP